MTSDEQILLASIEEGVNQHGGDLGGWTKLDDESLKLFDGRVTLSAEIHPGDPMEQGVVHAHVFTKLHDHDDEVLDACLMGIADTKQEAIKQAAFIWLTCVAGPIRSFLDNKPVCMSCQAGVAHGDASQGYVQGDYGLPGLRAFVGPSLARGSAGADDAGAELDDSMPWFRYASTAAAPRQVHLAKVTLMYDGEGSWHRQLEIDGHDVSFSDSDWPGRKLNDMAYFLRFAVFEFPKNSKVISQRAHIEKAIKMWLKNYNKIDDPNVLMRKMAEKGIHPQIVKEVESISTIAFGRMFFEHLGVNYSPVIIRARASGQVEENVQLLTLPAYTRARALFGPITESMTEEEVQAICFYNAESHGILNILEQSPEAELNAIELYPSVVPDENAPQPTIDRALAILDDMVNQSRKKKPWWKFW